MRRHLRTIFITLFTLTLVAAACSSGDGIATRDDQQDPGGNLELIASLQPVDSCDALLAHLQEEALARVGPYGFGDDAMIVVEDLAEVAVPSPGPSAAGGDDTAAAPQTPATTTPGVSGTNVQEAGVDEPDLVKADGERMLVVAGGELHWIDLTGDEPIEAGSVALPAGYGQQLLVAGDRALVLVSGDTGIDPLDGDAVPTTTATTISGGTGSFAPPTSALTTTIAQVDISSPDAMAVVDTLQVEGSTLDGRLIGDTARVVVTSSPEQLAFVYPSSPTPEAEQAAEETNRRIIEESEISDWLPAYRRITDPAGSDEAVVDEGSLVACDRMEQPSEFSGFGTLSVLTFDVPGELGTGDAVGVLADGDNIYASTDHLYVATTQYPEVDDTTTDPTNDFPEPPPAPHTAIHRFAIDGDGPAEYELSGAVRGHLLDQFSMSEVTGGDDVALLRVATTDDADQESYVTVLGPDNDRLAEVGQVGGLGEGEQIYSVRFVGEIGYVVTFRQTDPLYTVDLSDPTAPSVAGELELLGYSAYLHPIGDDLLLGVGQDATAGGQTTGTQLSLFDVSDPADPQRLQQVSIPGASSAAEYDHHAFVYWPDTGLAVLPVQSYGGDVFCSQPEGVTVPCPGPTEAFNGAVGFHVATDGIDEVGRITHDDGSALARSVVVGDTLYTISDASLVASDLTTLSPQSTLSFG